MEINFVTDFGGSDKPNTSLKPVKATLNNGDTVIVSFRVKSAKDLDSEKNCIGEMLVLLVLVLLIVGVPAIIILMYNRWLST